MPNDIVPEPGIPIWLRGFLNILLQQGVAVVVSLFLVWFITQHLSDELSSIRKAIEEHDTLTIEATTSMSKFAKDSEDNQIILIRLQRQTCLNTAKTDEQRRGCINGG